MEESVTIWQGRDCMEVGLTTYAIGAYHHWCCEFEPRSWRGVPNTTLCDEVCQWLATGLWFSPVSSTNKTDRHDITRILLKVVLNTINQTLIYCANLWSKVTVSELLRLLVPGSSGSGWSNTVRSKSVPPSNLITTSHKKESEIMLLKGHNSYNNLQTWLFLFELIRDIIKCVKLNFVVS